MRTKEQHREQLRLARLKRWGAKTAEERFWEKVQKTDSCWLWTAQKTAAGYGMSWIGKDCKYSHRQSYEYLIGPIPEGLELDHLCRNPICCNPAHLDPVTHKENMRRAVRQKYRVKNTCKEGHDWGNPKNVYFRRNGTRWCAECNRTKWYKRGRNKPKEDA